MSKRIYIGKAETLKLPLGDQFLNWARNQKEYLPVSYLMGRDRRPQDKRELLHTFIKQFTSMLTCELCNSNLNLEWHHTSGRRHRTVTECTDFESSAAEMNRCQILCRKCHQAQPVHSRHSPYEKSSNLMWNSQTPNRQPKL